MIQLNQRLDTYIDNVEEYFVLHEEYSQNLEKARNERRRLLDDKGQEEAQAYYKETVYPLSLQTSNLYLNLRYFSLAALSLRRYVAGRVYLNLKSRYIAELANPEIRDGVDKFLTEFRRFLTRFETSIVPHLVSDDI
jgi:hypothetical protein